MLGTVVILGSGVLGGLFVAAPGVGSAMGSQEADPVGYKGRVVVVGDSIMLGARPQFEAAFGEAGYEILFDAAVSRSTLAGAGAVGRDLAAAPADAVVVMFGANDAGDTETFRQRVRAVVQSTALVPHLYWLTIPEVRSYYPAANQVIREELALRPGARVLDWHAVSSGAGMTAGDGLHLTPSGADVMAWFVAVSVLSDLEPAPSTTTQPATTAPTTTTPQPATTAAPDATKGTGSDRAQVDAAASDAADAADSSVFTLAARTLVGVGLVVALLVVAGLGLGVWSIWRTRAMP